MKEFTTKEREELKRIHADVSAFEECEKTYLHLPLLLLPAGCVPAAVEALLCAVERDGYESRLFFAEPIKGPRALNWNAKGIRIGDRQWHAFSWRTPAGLRPAQMIAAHLQALK